MQPYPDPAAGPLGNFQFGVYLFAQGAHQVEARTGILTAPAAGPEADAVIGYFEDGTLHACFQAQDDGSACTVRKRVLEGVGHEFGDDEAERSGDRGFRLYAGKPLFEAMPAVKRNQCVHDLSRVLVQRNLGDGTLCVQEGIEVGDGTDPVDRHAQELDRLRICGTQRRVSLASSNAERNMTGSAISPESASNTGNRLR